MRKILMDRNYLRKLILHHKEYIDEKTYKFLRSIFNDNKEPIFKKAHEYSFDESFNQHFIDTMLEKEVSAESEELIQGLHEISNEKEFNDLFLEDAIKLLKERDDIDFEVDFNKTWIKE